MSKRQLRVPVATANYGMKDDVNDTRSAPQSAPSGLREGYSCDDEAPRERILDLGPAAATKTELLAAILGVDERSASALELAASLLARFGDLHRLLHAPREALAACAGMDPAKTAAIVAVRGLLDSYHTEVLTHGEILSSSTKVRRFLRYRFGRREREVFGALFLDTRHHLISNEELFFGSVDRAMVYPREVIKSCLKHNASAVILYHNHPSGVPEPSASDIQVTSRIAMLLQELDVRLVDHVVVSASDQVSFAERGLI